MSNRWRGRLSWIVIAAAVVVVVAVPSTRHAVLSFFGIGADVARSDVIYTCPMHPEIRLTQAGDCPICGMSLVEKTTMDVSSDGLISVTPQQVQLTGITVTPVESRSLSRRIDAYGKIDYDETRLAVVSAWIGGRIDHLFVDFTGVTVEKGHPLVSLYSPDLISTGNEYLIARRNLERVRESGRADLVRNAEELVRAARQRLLRWGLTAAQIDEIAATGQVEDHVTIYAPQGGTVIEKHATEGMYVKEGDVLFRVANLEQVWLNAEVYEDDIPYLYASRPDDYFQCPMHLEVVSDTPAQCRICGMELVRTNDAVTVDISARAFSGETFAGKVAFTDPVLNPETRTVRIRVNVANPGQKLKPNMYARARINLPVDDVLAVPENAVIQTGSRNIVLVEQEPGRFRPQIVRLGRMWLEDTERERSQRAQLAFKREAVRFHEVLEGLAEDDAVVTSGNFLLGSESQLQGALANMMAMEGTPTAPRHHHDFQDEPDLDAILDNYYRIWEALAADTLGGIPEAATAIAERAKTPSIQQATAPLRHAHHTGDIDATRTDFETLSHLLIEYVATHRDTSAAGPAQAYCPMADANWLQPEGELLNPYYGSKMLHCGKFIPWEDARR